MKPIDLSPEVSQQLHGATITHVTPATKVTPWRKSVNIVVNFISNTCRAKQERIA